MRVPADDPRIVGTVAAIQAGLTVDGLVQRYLADECSATSRSLLHASAHQESLAGESSMRGGKVEWA